MAAEPEVRRASDPRVVKKIHSAIKKTCEQKQCPILERIQRALTIDKVQITRSRIETQLKNAIRDGLIIESNGGNRGKSPSSSSTSEVKTSFRIPSLENFYENYEDDGHDWYCWVCHREGEVYLCSRCPRVIHRKCAELTQEDLEGDFVCYCCNDLDSTKQYGKKEIQELATMLSFTVDRMKSKCEELWKSPDEELHPNYRLFIYQDTSLNDLEKRVAKREFDSLAKFHYEIEWLFHNAVIYFGGENKLTELARMVVLDGQNELSQIDICSECYMRSNERMKNWYSIPCIPEHRIVYAKLGSDPPWPAKVLRENEDGSSIDVRFFGNPYQRAWIPKRNIWDLDEKPPMKKRSKALSQAEDELKIYLRLLTGTLNKSIKGSKSSSDSSEEEIDDDSDQEQEESKFKTKASKKIIPTPTSKLRGRPRGSTATKQKLVESEDDDDGDGEEEEEEEEFDDGDAASNDDYGDDEYEPSSKRSKKRDKGKRRKQREEKDSKMRGRKGTTSKRKASPDSLAGSSGGKETKAERRFREMQEKKMMEFQKTKHTKGSNKNFKMEYKVDINKNIGSDGGEDPSDMQLAQQIKMTDDYKMIEKLQERLRQLEKSLDTSRSDYESAQADLESTRIDLASEKQKCKRLQEQVEKDVVIGEEKLRNEILGRKQDEIDQAVEEERKRNELEFQSRMAEAIQEERAKGENRLQEGLEKERMSLENKGKMMVQREREELQRNFDRYKNEIDLQHSRGVEKLKVESDELTKRTLADNMRRIQAETERMLAAAKKKSWCSNCTKEAFYHCCWNTNYCSTDCQRVHWVSHRYQCSREMMYTCRSCQQRQNFAGSFASQVPPK